jgi:ribosomal protein L7/L12
MMRLVLIALAVLLALRVVARLAAREGPLAKEPLAPPHKAPALDDAQRSELEAAREQALREGRQIDAIKIHRELTGAGLAQAKDEMDAARRRRGGG